LKRNRLSKQEKKREAILVFANQNGFRGDRGGLESYFGAERRKSGGANNVL